MISAKLIASSIPGMAVPNSFIIFCSPPAPVVLSSSCSGISASVWEGSISRQERLSNPFTNVGFPENF